MLLTKKLTSICSEISDIRIDLWMAYTRSVEGFEKVEKMGGRWMYFASLTFDQYHQRCEIAVGYSSKVKGI